LVVDLRPCRIRLATPACERGRAGADSEHDHRADDGEDDLRLNDRGCPFRCSAAARAQRERGTECRRERQPSNGIVKLVERVNRVIVGVCRLLERRGAGLSRDQYRWECRQAGEDDQHEQFHRQSNGDVSSVINPSAPDLRQSSASCALMKRPAVVRISSGAECIVPLLVGQLFELRAEPAHVVGCDVGESALWRPR
jgi:hypothetical protein